MFVFCKLLSMYTYTSITEKGQYVPQMKLWKAAHAHHFAEKFRKNPNLNDRELLVIIQKVNKLIWSRNIQGEIWRRKIYGGIPKHANIHEFVVLDYIDYMQGWVHSFPDTYSGVF